MAKRKFIKRILIALGIAVFLLVAILVSLYFAIQSHKVQTFITQKITESISENINGDVSIGNVEIEFFNSIKLDSILIEDARPDTLAYIGHIEGNFSYFSLLDHTISLDNLTIKDIDIELYRAFDDSTFNIAHLFTENKDLDKTTASGDAWNFSIGEMTIENTRFRLSDYYAGDILDVKVPLLDIVFNDFDFANEWIAIESIDIRSPFVSYIKKESNPNKAPPEITINIPIEIEGNQLKIENGSFLMVNEKDTTTYNRFAANDIAVEDITLEAQELYIYGDSVFTILNQLSAAEKSGLLLKEMQSEVVVTNSKIALNNLNLKTAHSTITDYLALEYDSFDDFDDFLNAVKLNGNFDNTKISPKDIGYFVDIQDKLKYPIQINGTISGKISNIRGKDIAINTGKKSSFKGEISLNGLPNIKETFISLKVNQFITDYDDLKNIYPPIPLPVNMQKLGQLYFEGRFDGFPTDFVTYGKFQTDIGLLDLDANFKVDEQNQYNYSGHFDLRQFNIGYFLGAEKWIEKVSLVADIEGKGLKLETLDAEINGRIDSVNAYGYTYKNVIVNGALSQKHFNGLASIDDENVKIDFEGIVDASGQKPIFDFKADIQEAHLQTLNLLNKPYIFSTNLTANFSATTIDDVIGNMSVNNLAVITPDRSYTMNQFALGSYLLSNGEKRIALTSDNINATAEGNFQFSNLPAALKQVFLPNDTSTLPTQIIRFDANISDKSELMTLFVPQIRIPNKTIEISGNLNSETESILASVYIPTLYYNDFKAKRFVSNVQIQEGYFDIIISLPKIKHNDSIVVDNLSLLVEGPRENLTIKLNAGNKKYTSGINIVAHLTKIAHGRMLQFEPSTIVANKNYWAFDEKNKILFKGKEIASANLRLYSDISDLFFDINIDENRKDVSLDISNLEIADFTDFLQKKDIRIEGLVNGQINVQNINEKPLTSGNIEATDININGYSVGDLTTSADLDLTNQKINVLGKLFGNENDIDISGSYSFAKKSTANDFDIRFDIQEFAVKSIEDFIPEYINDTEGTINGHVYLTGKRNAPSLLGHIDLPDVTTTIAYTQTRYNAKNQRVLLQKNFINLGDSLEISDMDGNLAWGSGGIHHNYLKDITVDIHAFSPKIKGLNTTSIDNDVFYGTAYLNGGISFTGLTNDIHIHVFGESEKQGKNFTEIFIPLYEGEVVQQHEFYTFISDNKNINSDEATKEDEKIKLKGASVKLDLDIDEDCKVNIILDQAAGDVLKAQGNGTIKIDVARKAETVEFTGTYSITKGDYLFTLQNLVNKRFKIEPNSMIHFNGPIEEAQINVSATYGLRSSTYTLIQDYLINSDEDENAKNAANNRVPVNLYLKLSDRLEAPTINFEIEVEQVDNSIKSYVDNKIQIIQQYENELNRQVLGLLVLNQFLPTANSALATQTNSYISGGAANTVSEFISNQLSRYFNDALSYVVDDLDFNFNYRAYDQEANFQNDLDELTLQKRREFQLALSKRFLNDRIAINLGGNVDFGEDFYEDGANSTYFGGDFSLEYAITKDKRLRAKAFTITDYNHLEQENQTKFGAGLSYKREFDKIGEFFGIKRKNKKVEPSILAPTE
ncbi:MAG: translocation/assembly module TamB domain-containing protein [Chitinophagales bacterium]